MRRGLVPTAMLLCGAAAVLLRAPLAEANAARRLPGMRYSPRPKLAKLLSLGHRSTASDLLWLSAIGDLGKDFGDPQRKRRWLDTVFSAITTLEPTFATVYSFGSTYLTMIDPDPDKAIALLELGVANNPGNIKLAIELAMAHYVSKHDRDAAMRVLAGVVRDPRCDSLTVGFYASLLVDRREDFAALAQWEAWREHPNEVVQDMAELQQERAKRRIAMRAVEEFRQSEGRPPRSRVELRRPGLMAPEVVDVVLDAVWIDTSGRARFPRLEEFELRHSIRAANRWIPQFQSEFGRVPTLDEILSNRGLRLPPPPTGRRYELRDARLELVDFE
jgi:hypothetical protein